MGRSVEASRSWRERSVRRRPHIYHVISERYVVGKTTGLAAGTRLQRTDRPGEARRPAGDDAAPACCFSQRVSVTGAPPVAFADRLAPASPETRRVSVRTSPRRPNRGARHEPVPRHARPSAGSSFRERLMELAAAGDRLVSRMVRSTAAGTGHPKQCSPAFRSTTKAMGKSLQARSHVSWTKETRRSYLRPVPP